MDDFFEQEADARKASGTATNTGPGHRRKRKSRDKQQDRRVSSNSSMNLANPLFFVKEDQVTPEPSHTHTYTNKWRSQDTKDRDEYHRIHQRVRYIAPEQFKDNAKPTNEKCNIFPKDVAEWKKHKFEMLGMVAEDKLKEAKRIAAQFEALSKIPRDKRFIKSAFGKDGKVFSDGRSPVLCELTIWSAEFDLVYQSGAPWPDLTELKWNGDWRENKLATTRCGRYLPHPRVPPTGEEPFSMRSFLMPFSFDQTGPIFDSGPHPGELQMANAVLDSDMNFRDQALSWLGDKLMEEIDC